MFVLGRHGHRGAGQTARDDRAVHYPQPGQEHRTGRRRGRLLLQDFLDRVAAGTAVVPIGHVYRLDQIVEAHAAMEANRVSGKLVVLT
jgi:NADPH:quinone reductase-like Zn-dependent oxidoreductase